MTYTERVRAARPQVTRKRDARTLILRAVYGPSIKTGTLSHAWGMRDFAKRAPFAKRLEVMRAHWREAAWSQEALARVVADAGFGLNDLDNSGDLLS